MSTANSGRVLMQFPSASVAAQRCPSDTAKSSGCRSFKALSAVAPSGNANLRKVAILEGGQRCEFGVGEAGGVEGGGTDAVVEESPSVLVSQINFIRCGNVARRVRSNACPI